MPADGASLITVGAHGVVGWASAEYAALGLYLGVAPGIIGHVGFNVLLLYLSPLVLTLAQTLDPPIGAFIGERLPKCRRWYKQSMCLCQASVNNCSHTPLSCRLGSFTDGGAWTINIPRGRTAADGDRDCHIVCQPPPARSFA